MQPYEMRRSAGSGEPAARAGVPWDRPGGRDASTPRRRSRPRRLPRRTRCDPLRQRSGRPGSSSPRAAPCHRPAADALDRIVAGCGAEQHRAAVDQPAAGVEDEHPGVALVEDEIGKAAAVAGIGDPVGHEAGVGRGRMRAEVGRGKGPLRSTGATTAAERVGARKVARPAGGKVSTSAPAATSTPCFRPASRSDRNSPSGMNFMAVAGSATGARGTVPVAVGRPS